MLKSAFFHFLRMWSCSWLAFIFSIIPLYIFRGLYFGQSRVLVENILMSVSGLVLACLLLVIVIARNDAFRRMKRKEIITGTLGGAILYVILWTATKGLYLISVCGRHFALLLSRSVDGVTFLSAFLSAVVFCTCYAVAILLGAFIARKKRV